MKDQRTIITAAITSLFALGIATSSPSASAADEEKCWGVAKAGQNACNSNKSKHSCAGHSKIDNDPSDYLPLPVGSCLKIGGMLEPAVDKNSPAEKK